MTGIEKITARILGDAQAECDAVSEASAQRCAALRAENERRAQELYKALVLEGVKDTEQKMQRVDRTAKLEVRKDILSMKQDEVSRAFSLALQKLAGLPEADYVGFLAKLASQAVITGQEEVILSADDRAAVGGKVVKAANELLQKQGRAGGLSLSDTVRQMSGGLILKQGEIEVNCTLDTLLELSRNELAAQVAEVLFEA